MKKLKGRQPWKTSPEMASIREKKEVLVTQSYPTLCDPLDYGPQRLCPSRILCPWNSPGKNTGVHSYSLLQGIFLT